MAMYMQNRAPAIQAEAVSCPVCGGDTRESKMPEDGEDILVHVCKTSCGWWGS